ncbi:pectate lyase family protein [Marinimicrobium koreense]|uniref:pectate lyase family protein n=1 Tax=Marinimicrobium koreense TaxID=306545 RepID=UPI003F711C5D
MTIINQSGRIGRYASMIFCTSLFCANVASADLGPNLALDAGVDGSSKGGGTSYGNAIDGDTGSYWQPGSSSDERIGVKNIGSSFNTVIIRELNGATTGWRLEDHDTGEVFASGSTLGSERIISGFGDQSLYKVNLVIESANAAPQIAEFEVYSATDSESSSSSSSSSSTSSSSSSSESSSSESSSSETSSDISSSESSSFSESSSSSSSSSQSGAPGEVLSCEKANTVQGFASLGAGTTGGQGGDEVTVSTGSELAAALSNKGSAPLTIYVDGTITPDNSNVTKFDIKDMNDVSIIGVGDNALFDGIGIKIWRANNVIVRNVTMRYVRIGDKDHITIDGPSSNIWIDHNTFYNSLDVDKDYYDELVSGKGEIDNITISYNILRDSWKTSLWGSSDGDDYDRRITFWGNHWENANSRLPLFRFGEGHIVNNYYDGVISTGINSRMGATLRIEGNVFEDAQNPIVSFYSSELGYWDVEDNTFNNVNWVEYPSDGVIAGPDVQSTTSYLPPYSYSRLFAADTKAHVLANAGAGIVTDCLDAPVSGGGEQSSSSSSSSQNSSSESSSESSSSGNSSSDSGEPVELGSNLALSGGADGSSKGGGTSYGNVNDGNLASYWQPSGTSGERIGVKNFSGTFNTVIIRELNGATESWRLEDHDTNEVLASGSTLGSERIITGFGDRDLYKVNLIIDSASSAPQIAEFEIYNATGDVSDGGSSSSDSSSSSSSNSSDSSDSSSSDSSSSDSSSSDSSSSSSQSSSSFPDYSGPLSNDCVELATNPNVNWRDTSLQTDQEIVECLAQTLGRAVGYGENALGGYDPNGNSTLTVITKSSSESVEQQIFDAMSSEDHHWIVFDKNDFAAETEIGMYRLHCSNSDVLSRIGGTEAECVDYRQWCSNRGYNGHDQCLEEFFNNRLDDKDLPIRNPVISSNTTIDGRMSNAYFRFSGFAIGKDSSGQPTQTANSVILTHLDFRGAGHTEDHGLDPDMIRSTGASHDIWIHKNTFDLTGDSAFDVKVGAYDITMSFNRVVDVKRASLHGSSDSRSINEDITTTMHHNAFVTRDDLYFEFGNTARRVPLIRRGTSHMWNNLFMNYRKDIISVRVGADLLWEDNALVINGDFQEKDDINSALDELQGNLTRDVSGGNYRADGVYLWFGNSACDINASTQRALADASGSVGDLSQQYTVASRDTINDFRLDAGQDLIDYVSATAGKHGELPFNSPLAGDIYYVLSLGKVPCQ